MMELRLNDPLLASELVTFLRRCDCDVQHLGPSTLGVGLRHPIDVQTALQQLRAGRCYLCAEEIEPALAGLGSPLCLDCRQGSNGRAAELEEGPVRDEWARMEVEAYLKVWCALHPECNVELVA
jgi:hypothetical protein